MKCLQVDSCGCGCGWATMAELRSPPLRWAGWALAPLHSGSCRQRAATWSLDSTGQRLRCHGNYRPRCSASHCCSGPPAESAWEGRDRDRRVGEERNEKERIGVRDTGRGGMERVEPDYDVMVLLSDFDLCR